MFVRYLGPFFHQGGHEDSYGIEQSGNCISQMGFF